MKPICPLCELELQNEEARSYFMKPDYTEIVWVCKNKECKNFDEVVFDDLELNSDDYDLS